MAEQNLKHDVEFKRFQWQSNYNFPHILILYCDSFHNVHFILISNVEKTCKNNTNNCFFPELFENKLPTLPIKNSECIFYREGHSVT